MNPEFPDSPHAALLGSGSWGTALASLLATNASQVTLVGRDPAVCEDINSNHRNERYLPGVPLADSLRATGDLDAATTADVVLFVVAGDPLGADPFELCP